MTLAITESACRWAVDRQSENAVEEVIEANHRGTWMVNVVTENVKIWTFIRIERPI